ncbi:ABC transporter permease [Rhabdobacter roseus]|uniref:Putative permease n=1 Tax=Rhabdobacter roseus TaxID=1655419 RepID=A0A840TQF0_9BACT|nr:ABC transporter permease [Rhabdobacter roseus]MBB5285554.1 putative permease [Rhabdobacter roseus]
MIRNYLTIAWRNLWRNKLYSSITVFGLAVGLASTVLILLWVKYEVSHDRFHVQHDRIYRIMLNLSSPANETQTYDAVPMPMAEEIKAKVPGIERATRYSWGERSLFSFGDQSIMEEGRAAEPDFLKIFSFELLQGNPATALTEPNTLLLTQRLARKYFGNENPIGKQIQLERAETYRVVGVIADIPPTSSLNFGYLRPFRAEELQSTDWGENNIQLFALLTPEANPATVQTQLQRIIQRHLPTLKDRAYFLHSLNDWYLRSNFKDGKYSGRGRIVYVWLFGLVAVLILLIAGINFVNLSTARATQRAKEVGVRKAAGASQETLMCQFLGESMLLTFIAGLLALGLVSTALPFYNELLEKPYFGAPAQMLISIDWQNPRYYVAYGGILVFLGLSAGLYPAFVLSSFRPAWVLKGLRDRSGQKTAWLRKSLVVTQFTAAILLLIGTMVVYRQIQFIQNINLGFQKDNLIYFNTGNVDISSIEPLMESFAQLPGVQGVTRANTDFLGVGRAIYPDWPGQTSSSRALTGILNGDEHLLATMDIHLKAGRDFSSSFGTDSANVLLNEEAAKRFGFENPVGHPITVDGISGTVIGVVKDFHLTTIHSRIEPLIIRFQPSETQLLFARIDGRNIAGTLSAMEQTYQKVNPGFPLNFIFLDQAFDWMYRSERQVGTLAKWFAGLAFFISCLGLFGLATFTAEQRTKEIGVRKVLGASVVSIVALLSKDFLKLVLIAILIASPIAWYAMKEWLADFAYKIEISWWYFALAGGLAVGIALLTVSFQSVKAALMNPVKSLRSE